MSHTVDLVAAVTRRPSHTLAPTTGFAAVAAVFGHADELLFIRRAAHPTDPWSGHVAFPGGRMEPADAGPLDAAIRETREELGLDLSPDHLLGALDDIAAVGGRPGLVVRPFVFRLPGPVPALRPNGEVAAVMQVPLARLLAGDGRGPMPYVYQGMAVELPRVDFAGHRLWGLTLRMVDDLLDRIDGRGAGLARVTRGA